MQWRGTGVGVFISVLILCISLGVLVCKPHFSLRNYLQGSFQTRILSFMWPVSLRLGYTVSCPVLACECLS